jgi:protein-tyrosine-phosphatase
VAERVRSVLFLCTGNSARSLVAECLLDRIGHGRFRAYSAGSQPKAAPHPQTLALLRELGYETARLRSKSWDEFASSGASSIDLVVTVCDAAADAACPFFPGGPARLHWSIDDPAAVTGSAADVRAAFRRAYDALERRIDALVKESA